MDFWIVFVTLIWLTIIQNAQMRSKHCSKDYHFDYILLAVQWPETFCERTKCAAHKNKWSIHGAWPENYDGSWNENCCTQHRFQADILKPIESDLKKHWKTLKAHSSNEKFWSHEYQKHGTCAIESPLLKDELSYFNNTLNVFKTLDIQEWLSDAGIKISSRKSYRVDDFHDAIADGVGYDVMLQCTKTKYYTCPVISQINFCLDKNTLEPFDCPWEHKGCKESVFYPRRH